MIVTSRFASVLCAFGCLIAALPAWAVGVTSVQLPLKRVGSSVQVSFPGGPLQLVLEGRSGNGWKPLAVQYVNKAAPRLTSAWTSRTSILNAAGVATFAMPAGYTLAQLRVTSSPAKHPSTVVTKPKDFPGPLSEAASLISSATSNIALRGSVALESTTSGTVAGSVAVTESDIWKVVGNQLFFFNQYRGLQVFDVSNAQGPVRTGSLRLPASGEQFYALDATASHLALVGRDQSVTAGSAGTDAVYVLSVTAGRPSLVTKLPVQGYAADSRLIGSCLYVAAYSYGWNQATLGFTSSVIVQGFDLADPEHPVTFTPVTMEGYWPVLQASSDTLLVASTSVADWLHSRIHVLDISQNGGQPALIKTLTARGLVQDKFNLQSSNGVVSVVSNLWNWLGSATRRENWVETFSSTGTDTAPLAQLELVEARGETLHATRFDGSRLYAVTFRNIDPLFVVDLSNPAAPAVMGHVDVPGWSSYIEPYGDRLLAVGVEGGRVAVSLFDVSNPAAPALLSRVPLGTGSSWSEANYDEKAVGFFPDRGVVLVPYQTWNNQGWQSATAVIEVTPSAVTYKSSILHQFTARRAALAGDNIISISGQELIVDAAADLAAPRLLAELSLSWTVDRVLPFGRGHLIQIEDGSDVLGYYGGFVAIRSLTGGANPMLRISRVGDPDALVEEVEMGPGRVIGVELRNGRLFVGQHVQGANRTADVIRTWVFDASAPPALPEVSHVDTTLPADTGRLNFDQARALWPKDDTLVWHIPTYAYWGWPFLVQPQVVAFSSAITVNVGVSSGSAQILRGGLTSASSMPPNPAMLVLRLGTPAQALNARSPVRSMAKSTAASAVNMVTAGTLTLSGSIGGGGVLSQTSDVASSLMIYPWFSSSTNVAAVLCPVSLAVPSAPAALAAITISGVSGAGVRISDTRAFAAGGFLFTSYQEDPRNWGAATQTGTTRSNVVAASRMRTWLQVLDFRNPGAPVMRDRVSLPGELAAVSDVDDRGAMLLTNHWNNSGIQACAYDGVNAYQVDSWTSTEAFQLFTADSAGRLLLARTWSNPGVTSLGFDAATGRLRVLGTLSLPHPVYQMHATGGFLLTSSWGKVDATTITAAGALESRATFDTPASLWVQVSRAATDPAAGIWLPVGAYGVEFLGFTDIAATASATP